MPASDWDVVAVVTPTLARLWPAEQQRDGFWEQSRDVPLVLPRDVATLHEARLLGVHQLHCDGGEGGAGAPSHAAAGSCVVHVNVTAYECGKWLLDVSMCRLQRLMCVANDASALHVPPGTGHASCHVQLPRLSVAVRREASRHMHTLAPREAEHRRWRRCRKAVSYALRDWLLGTQLARHGRIVEPGDGASFLARDVLALGSQDPCSPSQWQPEYDRLKATFDAAVEPPSSPSPSSPSSVELWTHTHGGHAGLARWLSVDTFSWLPPDTTQAVHLWHGRPALTPEQHPVADACWGRIARGASGHEPPATQSPACVQALHGAGWSRRVWDHRRPDRVPTPTQWDHVEAMAWPAHVLCLVLVSRAWHANNVALAVATSPMVPVEALVAAPDPGHLGWTPTAGWLGHWHAHDGAGSGEWRAAAHATLPRVAASHDDEPAWQSMDPEWQRRRSLHNEAWRAFAQGWQGQPPEAVEQCVVFAVTRNAGVWCVGAVKAARGGGDGRRVGDTECLQDCGRGAGACGAPGWRRLASTALRRDCEVQGWNMPPVLHPSPCSMGDIVSWVDQQRDPSEWCGALVASPVPEKGGAVWQLQRVVSRHSAAWTRLCLVAAKDWPCKRSAKQLALDCIVLCVRCWPLEPASAVGTWARGLPHASPVALAWAQAEQGVNTFMDWVQCHWRAFCSTVRQAMATGVAQRAAIGRACHTMPGLGSMRSVFSRTPPDAATCMATHMARGVAWDQVQRCLKQWKHDTMT